MSKATGRTCAVLGGLGTLIHVEHTAELAYHLCEGHNTELLLVYLVIVPHTLPLDAPMPDQEQAAEQAIASGMRIAQKFGCHPTPLVIRHREPVDAILELVRDEQIERIVLGIHINPNVPRDYDRAESAEAELLRRAPCEVIIDREPIVA